MTKRLFSISKFFLYLVPFTLVVVYQGSLFPFIVGKYAFFRTAVELALVFFIWGWALSPQARGTTENSRQTAKSSVASRKLLANPLVIAVAVFVFVYVLAGFFGVDPSSSFWSNFERGEGGLQLLHLLTYFLLLIFLFRDWDSWRRLLIVSIVAGVCVIGYGFLGSLKYVDAAYGAQGNITGGGAWYRTFSDFIGGSLCERFSASLGNPAYVGTYMIFLLFYSSFLVVRQAEGRWRWLWGFLILLSLVTLLLSQTRGAFLGLIAGIAAACVYLLVRARRRLRLGAAVLLILLLAGGGILLYEKTSINIMPWCAKESQILDISVGAGTFETRLVLWRKALDAWRERPILGWGPENFSAAIEKHFDPALSAAWFDRAHSIFFDYLVMSGALGLLAFLGIFAALYLRFLRRPRPSSSSGAGGEPHKKTQLPVTGYQSLFAEALLFGLPVAYLVQGAVLFDVLPTYINLFLFLAFSVYVLNGNKNPT